MRWVRVLLILLAGVSARAWADGGGFCSSCELQLGGGATFHYWSWSHSPVVPIVFTLDGDRYEIGAFRMVRSQNFYDDTFLYHVTFAQPYWGFSAMRRIELLRHPHWRVLLGLGFSYKTAADTLSASHWNFAEMVGLRFTPARGFNIDVLGRHWSNAGLKLPNHGQDFVTVTFTVVPALLR